MRNKRLVLIPLTALVYFFVHFTTDLFYFMKPVTVLQQFIKYVLISLVLFFTGYTFLRDKERFTLCFTSILFIFLFYGTITDMLAAYHLLKTASAIDIISLFSFLVFCLLIILICQKLHEKTIKKILFFWLIYLSVLIIYDTGSFIFSGKKEKDYITTVNYNQSFKNAEKPTVFFLLFDMYPSDSSLHKYLGYDNFSLNSFLKLNGFYVTGNAKALYDQTYYSLGSTLSLQPLAYYHDTSIQEYKKKLIALKNIEHSPLISSFENSGYLFRNFSVFNLEGHASPLRFNLNYHLDNVLTASTFFNRVYEGLEPDFILANRNINLETFKTSWSTKVKNDIATLYEGFYKTTDSLTQFKNPSFNYFHFMIPHPPMIFDSSGKERPVKEMYTYKGFNKSTSDFISYIKYANVSLMKMVNKIFEKTGKNVIIIIQGDHGYREYADRFPDEMRLGILNSIYLPGKNYSAFNDSISPLETWKEVLTGQFSFQYHP